MNLTTTEPAKTARIIAFTNKRGRPKTANIGKDTGTPETVMKRALGLTSEALDLCLERGIINAQQHWCGIHLRWLYTLRYGVPSVRAVDPSHFGDGEPKIDDQDWKMAREQEYNEAITLLTRTGNALLLLNLCVYNERPKYLNFTPQEIKTMQPYITDSVARLRDGLDTLAMLWKK